MLKGFVSGEEKDIKRIPMKGKNLVHANSDRMGSFVKWQEGKSTFTLNGSASANDSFIFSTMNLKAGTYTLSIHGLKDIGAGKTGFYLSGVDTVRVQTNRTYTITEDTTATLRFIISVSDVSYDNEEITVMLNLGSTPLPYEPYGYQEGWEVRDNQDRLIWGREDELQTVTGTLPFKGYALPVKVKSLLGNAVQNGIPAPDNIITPEMCGVRTAQLIDYTQSEQGGIDASGNLVAGDSLYRSTVYVPVNTTITTWAHYTGYLLRLYFYKSDKTFISRIEVPAQTDYQIQFPQETSYIKWTCYRSGGIDISIVSRMNIMLNLGSTALPYEPYGWKVPFENHGENLFDCTRTEGIIDNSYIRKSDGATVSDWKYYISYPIYVSENVTYTWRFDSDTSAAHSAPTVGFYDASDNMIGTASHGDGKRYFSFTTPNGCKYIRASVYKYNDLQKEAMLNLGSEPAPYSPYLNETIPVYLGEVPTVRRVRKLVLTSTTAEWTYDSTYNRYTFRIADSLVVGVRLTPVACSHFLPISDGRSVGDVPNNAIYSNSQQSTNNWFIKTTDYTTASSFKQFLDDELAAGHPVTIWYVLANEQTGIVNEPLCKIFTYADELTTIQVHGLSAPLYGIGDYKDTLNLSTGVATMKVKKLVLDGTENITYNTVDRNRLMLQSVYTLPTAGTTTATNIICTHLETLGSGTATSTQQGIAMRYNGSDVLFGVTFATIGATVDDGNVAINTKFKSYLAAQYQNGTPVTIWYVLSTPETETVTVPTGMTGEIEGYLTQVSTPTPTNRSVPKWNGVEETGGTYAVTVYTPPEIPTTTGENTLTVDTTLAPSSLTVKGHIKELT